MRVCIKCDEPKVDGDFYTKKYGSITRLSGACKKCFSRQTGVYAKTHRRTIRTAMGRNKIFVDSLKTKPCQDCGGGFPPICMDFDHRPGEIKSRAVSRMMGQSRETILAEIAKCDLVCSNCHRIRTASRPKKYTKRKHSP